MTDEERERFERIERTLEFVASQQANFVGDIQKINETLKQHADGIVALTGWYGKLTLALDRLEQMQEGHEERIAVLETKMAEWAEAGKRTDERLDALIAFVEKYVSSRNGGGARKTPRRPKKK